MPQVRERVTTDYKKLLCLYLETADRQLFVTPYIGKYGGAVGRIYRSYPSNSRDGGGEADEAYIKSITPQIIHPSIAKRGEVLPIRVTSQEKRGEELILEVVVDFSPPYASHDFPRERDGNTYIVVLFLQSAQHLQFVEA